MSKQHAMNLLAAVLALAAVPGCKPPGARLVGTWEGTPALAPGAVAPAESDNPLERLQAQAAARMMEGIVRQVQVRVHFVDLSKVEVRLLVLGQEVKRSGDWEVIRADGDRLRIRVSGDVQFTPDDNVAGSHELEVEFDGDDAIVIQPLGGEGQAAGQGGFAPPLVYRLRRVDAR